MNEIEILIKEAKKEEKYFKNYLNYAEKIKREAEKLLGKVKVYVFGSVLKKDEVPRDIDILIISSKFKTNTHRSEIRNKILENLNLPAIFEIHLITPKEYKEWYKNFIDKKIEI